jgi:transcriptional regulator GlxA family with amidase domain
MAHVQHNTTCASATQTRKTTSGGLTPWRESLVKQLILDRLSDPLEVTELARACALSRSHFSRTFKCSTGLSPQDWIRCQRIARAKQLIEKTNLTLTQIGLECGFCDQAHFCHISPAAKASRLSPGAVGRCDPHHLPQHKPPPSPTAQIHAQ